MPSNRVANTASAVALTLTTNIVVVTVTPQPPGNQVNAGNVLVRAEVTITGAASATNATVSIIRGSAAAGTNILPSAIVQPVTTAATDTTIVASAVETAANFNATNGVYSLQVNQAGAATTARTAMIEVQPLQGSV